MPPLTLALVGMGINAVVAGIITSVITSLATSFVLGGLSKLLAPKPKGGNSAGTSVSRSGITTQIKQPIITRKPVYGEIRLSGGILFVGSTETNKFLHLIIELAPHEIDSIGEVWLDDYSIPPDALDANGNVISGRYSGVARIRKYLGTSTQAVDSLLHAEIPAWTGTLSGIAYVYVRLQWNQDIFPSGLPNISAWIKGKKIYDTRSLATNYSNNVALMTYDYLRDSEFGLNTDAIEIDSDFVNAAANTCDEFVTTENYDMVVSSTDAATDIVTLVNDTSNILFYQTGDKVNCLTTTTLPSPLATSTDYYVIVYQRKNTMRIKLAYTYADALAGTAINLTDTGTGTHTIRKIAEPRFTGGIQIDSADTLKINIESLLSGMGGKLICAGGSWRMMASSYQTPTVYFTVDDVISSIKILTKVSQRERFNTVSGTYISPINDGQPSDYPPVTNSTYVDEDGFKITKQIDLPATQRPHTAQRIVKVELEKSRQEITWTADFKLSAFQVQAGDNAFFTVERMGWTDKVFEIQSWKFTAREENGIHVPYVQMTMRETASGVYDWNNGEETAVDLAPNTDLPDPFTVSAITGLAADSEQVLTASGDYAYKILIQWDLISDQFVINGGFVEVQFKKSTEDTWRPTFRVPADFDFCEVALAGQLNDQYDLRLRAVNQMGVRSNYTTLSGFVVGSSGGVSSTNDWGNWTEGLGAPLDWGNWTDGVGSTDDWEYFS